MKLEKITGIELAFYKMSNKEAVTTSRILADHFNKRHDTVLRKIDRLKKEDRETFNALHLVVVKYKDAKGELRKEYVFNRDAYSFLAMSFTGLKANKFKLDFIQAFNKMEAWISDRLKNSIEYQIMSDTLNEVRQLAGKETKNHNYMVEAKLVNWVLTGEFKKLDREKLSQTELDLLYNLQKRNTVLIGAGMDYKDRKESLKLSIEVMKSK